MRSLKRIQRALTSSDHWAAFVKAFQVYRWPLRELRNYIFDCGSFPYECELNTAQGRISITLQNPHDLRVVHEIFCGRVYDYPQAGGQPVIDVGANIGISTLFFLSELGADHVTAFEPDPKNVLRFKENCRPLNKKITFNELAVAPTGFDGERTMSFGVEIYGHYGGLNRQIGELCDAGEHQITAKIDVNTISFTQLIRQQKAGTALIKLDTEGSELELLASLSRADIQHIQRVCIDGLYPIKLIENIFCPYRINVTPRGNSMLIEVLGNKRDPL